MSRIKDFEFGKADWDTVQELIRVAYSSSIERMMREIIFDSGVILDDHFVFDDRDSGLNKNLCHSQHLLRFRVLGRQAFICGELARVLLSCSEMKLDGHKVLTPEMSGFFLGHSVSQLIKPDDGKIHVVVKACDQLKVVQDYSAPFRSGEISPGDEVVVVNDVDRTGSALDRLVKIVRQFKGEVNKVLVFATWNYEDFQKRMAALGVKGYALIEFRAESWTRDKCRVRPQDNHHNDDL